MTATTEHPDVLARRAFWRPSVRFPSATRIATCTRVYAQECAATGCRSKTFTVKEHQGHGASKIKLAEPIPVCGRCGHLWESWEVYEHLKPGSPTRRPGMIRVSGTRPTPSSAEARIFGDRDVGEWIRLRRIAEELERSRAHHWKACAYFAFVIRFQGVRGRQGVRVLAHWAAEQWPRAPFDWTRYRAEQLVPAGREEWAKRLAKAGIIEGGEWWKTENSA